MKSLPQWTIAAVVVLSVVTVWLRLSIVKTTYSLNQTEKMILNLKEEKEKAILKSTALKSPRRLEILSKTKYELKQARSNQIVFMD